MNHDSAQPTARRTLPGVVYVLAAGIPAGAMTLVLIAFGVETFAGTTIGGRLGDRRPLAIALTATGATTIALLAVTVLSGTPGEAMVLVFAMGVTGLALDSSLGQTGPALVGTIIAALTLVPLTLLALPYQVGISSRSATVGVTS